MIKTMIFSQCFSTIYDSTPSQLSVSIQDLDI